jgi:hypothetical protein
LGETLHVYIHRFSRQCNELPDVADTDIIGAFLSRTTYEFFVHKLGHKRLRNTKELLDIATSHASSEEAVRAIFDRSQGKAKRDEDTDKGASNHSKKKNKQWHRDSLVATAERKGKKAPAEGALDHFKKLLEGPCLNHV